MHMDKFMRPVRSQSSLQTSGLKYSLRNAVGNSENTGMQSLAVENNLRNAQGLLGLGFYFQFSLCVFPQGSTSG